MIRPCLTCGLPLSEADTDLGVAAEHPLGARGHAPFPGLPLTDSDAKRVLRCHFCNGPHPVWMYETADLFTADDHNNIQEYANLWHACYRCADLIERLQAAELAERSLAASRWQVSGMAEKTLRLFQQALVQARYPYRTLLTVTRWPAAKLSADSLPKMRARLANLLRGPALLPQPLQGARRLLADGLDRGQLLWVDDENTDLAESVCADLPEAVITDDILPAPDGLMVWPRPVGGEHPIGAVSWTAHEQGWLIACYRSIAAVLDDDLMPQLRQDIGWLLPVHVEYVSAETVIDGSHPLAPAVTTWLLIDQTIAEVAAVPVSSSKRKSYQRGRAQPPEVKLVRIKARTQPGRQPGVSSGGSTRAEPDHRYWVSGHPRNQPYGPGRSLRRLIRIKPVLRGPEDAPIRLSTTVRVLGSIQRQPSDLK
ncbi:hypothetical protein [Catellatospora chokoriensis]|nr:hypothetical protein [Catellatospora chokoriensis]